MVSKWVALIFVLLSFALMQSVVAHGRDPWLDELFRLNRQPQCPSQVNAIKKAWNDEALKLTDVESVPPEQAKVIFSRIDGPDQKLSTLGEVLSPTIVQNAPDVKWDADEEKLYAVFMVDPDAPTRSNPEFGEWYHWGVLNVPGNDVSKGDVVTQYMGAGPPPGSGLHRYVILVYQQPRNIEVSANEMIGHTTEGRSSNKVRNIAAKHGLGAPIAGACFQAQWDDYVPKLYQGFN